jgi:peptidoglycan/xylan/chitin deacetylase (PgdA/CDA1 family)
MRYRILATIIGLFIAWANPAAAADSAVVLVYPRLVAGAPSDGAGLRLARLDAHLAELAGGSYRVASLASVVGAFRAGTALPDRTIVITFDDASLLLYREAWPRLKARNMPFAVFVAPQEVGNSGAMGWSQLREMKAAGVTIGLRASFGEEQAAADMIRAAELFAAELGERPAILAWPSGEASGRAIRAAREAGFAAAFGQHSGAAWAGHERFYLPRFAITEDYSDLERFRRVAAALPLPASDLTPANPRLGQNPPPFGFTLAKEFGNLDQLACFSAHDGRMKVELLGNRVEARMSKPFPPGRGRINCTLPNGDGRWRWFGYQWSVGR